MYMYKLKEKNNKEVEKKIQFVFMFSKCIAPTLYTCEISHIFTLYNNRDQSIKKEENEPINWIIVHPDPIGFP